MSQESNAILFWTNGRLPIVTSITLRFDDGFGWGSASRILGKGGGPKDVLDEKPLGGLVKRTYRTKTLGGSR